MNSILNNTTEVENTEDQDLCECWRCGNKVPEEEGVHKSAGDEYFFFCAGCADDLFY